MANEAKEITRAEQEGLTERKSEKPRLVPPVDVMENNDEILVLADLPGVAKEDLTIQMDNAELLICGSQSQQPHETSTWRVVEFYRTFRVPNTVDPEGISAELSQGVLRLKLKKHEQSKPRNIEIKMLQ